MKENDSFQLSKPIEAEIIGEHTAVTLPSGMAVTVVLVFGDPASPEAYEVEAYLPEIDAYALGTISGKDI
ncbi:hypothetical protein [Paraburkholderia sp. SG-MS1]|uniref:hypothetical protein n=1 Tax=Paraburkholderia sp. SG-MS1 TaxID=2023741 RepID=UPI001EEC6E5D|nr:hypothetical protein [Paraburkholderia sp. SG-MS1]